jgi:hypothetical protein
MYELNLQAWGLDFLPQKYWAIALPTYVSVLFVTFVCFIYPSLGLIAASKEEARGHLRDNGGYHHREVMEGAIPPIYEMTESEVNSWTRDTGNNNKTKKEL